MGSVKRNIDSVITELKALAEVGVIDEATRRRAKAYADNHEAEVEEMIDDTSMKISDIADLVVELSKVRGAGNPVGYENGDRSESTTEGESEMAAKKGKKAKGKAKNKAVKRAPRQAGGESRPRETIANYVRAELEKQGKDYDAKKIAEKAAEKFPGKKPTPGYVNWIHEHAPKVSTTTSAAA